MSTEEHKTKAPNKKAEFDSDEEEMTKRKPKKKAVAKEESEEDEDEATKRKPKKGKDVNQEAPQILTLSGAVKSQPKAADSLLLHEGKRILLKEVVENFKELDFDEVVAQGTKNQIVHLVEQKTEINFQEYRQIQDYIRKRGSNYNEVIGLDFLAQGGESIVFRAEIRQPIELVVKAVLPKQISPESISSILEESHLIKLLENPDHIVTIYEEVLEYSTQKNQIENYVSVVEQARNDLSRISRFWVDEQKCFENLEFFSNEKLLYFLIMTCKAIDYLHSQNVYYGDMKEANILVFRDYKVKLGDFGISIKLDLSVPLEEEKYVLKGLTKGYTLPFFEKAFDEDAYQEFSKYQLFKNDYFALFQTFINIKERVQQLPEIPSLPNWKYDPSSYFDQFLTELKDADPKGKPLRSLITKYENLFGSDYPALQRLCEQLLSDDKILAIPNVLKLWKHSKIASRVSQLFEQMQDEEFTFLNLEQKVKISQDEKLARKREVVTAEQIQNEILAYINHSSAHYLQEFHPLIIFLIQYRGSLHPDFYSKFFRSLFGRFYQVSTVSGPLALDSLDFDSQQDLGKFLNDGIFKVDNEHNRVVRAYLLFYASVLLQDERNQMEWLEQVSDMECPWEGQDLDVQRLQAQFLIFHKILELKVQVRSQFAATLRYITANPFYKDLFPLCKKESKILPLYKGTYFQYGYFPGILHYIQLNLFERQVRPRAVATLLQRDMRENKFMDKMLYQASAYLVIEILNFRRFSNSNHEIDVHQKIRQAIKVNRGELGNKMSENAFQLSQLLKKQYEEQKDKESQNAQDLKAKYKMTEHLKNYYDGKQTGIEHFSTPGFSIKGMYLEDEPSGNFNIDYGSGIKYKGKQKFWLKHRIGTYEDFEAINYKGAGKICFSYYTGVWELDVLKEGEKEVYPEGMGYMQYYAEVVDGHVTGKRHWLTYKNQVIHHTDFKDGLKHGREYRFKEEGHAYEFVMFKDGNPA